MSARTYKTLADVVTFFHFLWTFLVFGGALLVVFDHRYALIHIVILSVTLLSNVPFKTACPITIIERRLRRKADPSYDNTNSFTTTYLNKALGTRFLERNVNITIAVLYIISYSYSFYALFNR